MIERSLRSRRNTGEPVLRADLRQANSTPGNRLHPLKGDLSGYHAIRVNDQYRIVFRFEGHDAHDVRCADYH